MSSVHVSSCVICPYRKYIYVVCHGVHVVCTWCASVVCRGVRMVCHGVHIVCVWCHGVHVMCTWCASVVCCGVHIVCICGVSWCACCVCVVCRGVQES